MTLPYVLTVEDVAKILQVSTKTVYKLLHDGDLSYIMVRGSYRVTSTMLEEYLKGGAFCER